MKALCLGWVHNSALACREGWVGTTLRLFFNLAENKGTGLGTLREYANKFTCTSWVTLQKPQEQHGWGPGAWGCWSPSFFLLGCLGSGTQGERVGVNEGARLHEGVSPLRGKRRDGGPAALSRQVPKG